MTHSPRVAAMRVEIPYRYRQRGGSARPRSWLVGALIIFALSSAAMNVYQHTHRQIVINVEAPAPGAMQPSRADSGIFPDRADVCDNFFAICWKTA
jgi:hypothetical protein